MVKKRGLEKDEMVRKLVIFNAEKPPKGWDVQRFNHKW
jgi:hypothetical protein